MSTMINLLQLPPPPVCLFPDHVSSTKHLQLLLHKKHKMGKKETVGTHIFDNMQYAIGWQSLLLHPTHYQAARDVWQFCVSSQQCSLGCDMNSQIMTILKLGVLGWCWEHFAPKMKVDKGFLSQSKSRVPKGPKNVISENSGNLKSWRS